MNINRINNPAKSAALRLLLTILLLFLFIACSGKWPYAPEEFEQPERFIDFISADSLQQFISFTNAKIAFMEGAGKNRRVAIVHYSQGNSSPSSLFLRKPIELDASLAYPSEAPIISPDGEWVTYFLTDKASTNITLVQKLDSASLPVRFADGAAHPHWWQGAGGKLYIVYCSDASSDPGQESGYTVLQEVNPSSPATAIGNPDTIASAAYNGGMSADSQYLCNGDYKAYFFDIQSASAIAINSPNQVCNASISPDTGSLAHRMMFLNIGGAQNLANDKSSYEQHTIVYIVGTDNSKVYAFNKNDLFTESRGEWQDPEWSNHPDYFIALSNNPNRTIAPFDCIIVKIASQPEYIQVNNGERFGMRNDASPYLWIEKQ